jgi:hypothetical protein
LHSLLDEVASLLDDFIETVFLPASSVHLVDGNDELLDTEGVGEQSVLTSLAVLGDTSLELTSTGGNDENSAVSLGGTSDHVLDEVTVTGGVCEAEWSDPISKWVPVARQHTNDGDIVFRSLELPQGNIDGDTTLTLGLELVEHPSILEGALAKFGSFL